MGETEKKCPACGSSELLPGLWERHAFVPPWFKGKGIMAVRESYRTERFVCLHCGHASEFLPREELVALQANAAKHRGE